MLEAGGDELVIPSQIPWRPKSLEGLSEKLLWRSDETGASIALVRFAAGSGIPEPHEHASNQFLYCLQGSYEYPASGYVLKPQTFYWNPKGHVHGPTVAHENTLLLEIYDGPHYPKRPSWYKDDADAR